MEVYVKPKSKINFDEKRILKIQDISDVFSANKNLEEEIKNIILLNIKAEKRENFLITIMDIVKAIKNKNQSCSVINIGEKEVVIEFSPKKRKDNKIVVVLKIIAIAVVLFFGSATAIMSFHSDAEMNEIMKGYYKIFYGEETETPYILEIPYSIGLGVGIMVFFNHFSKLKMSYDPTPIEVQMTSYENEVLQNQLDSLSKTKEK